MAEDDPRRPLTASEAIINFDGRDDPDLDAEQEAKVRAEQRAVFLTRLMRDKMARDWLWELIAEFGTFEATYACGPTGFPDPAATAHYAGRRSAGWRIWTELDDIAPDLTSLMRREHR